MKNSKIIAMLWMLSVCMFPSCKNARTPVPMPEPHWFTQYKDYSNQSYYSYFQYFIKSESLKNEPFYTQIRMQYETENAPFWTANGYQEQLISEGIALIDSAFTYHGIPSEYFDYQFIKTLMDTIKSVKIEERDTLYRFLAQLEWHLTTAIIKYANALQFGASDPQTVNGGKWLYKTRYPDSLTLACTWAARNSLPAYFRTIAPADSHYKALQKELRQYQAWQNQTFEKLLPQELSEGMASTQIPLIINRLKLTGMLGNVEDTVRLTEPVMQAINRFRAQNAIPISSKLDLETIDALNRNLGYYVKKLIVNMEQLRWQIAEPKGANYLSVNFADFSLKTVLADTCAISMKICCGKSRKSAKAAKEEIAGIIKGYKMESPMLYGSINQIILYPEWNVPASIMEDEYYVKLKNNSQRVLEREKMYLVRTADRQAVDAAAVDWTKIKRKQIPYRLIQTSGYHNSLGIIKFNFPNVESVYLHDTPVKRAFGYRYRDISHGCIRVEKPLELAQVIFRYNDYTDEQFECIMVDLGKAPTTQAGKLYQEKRQQKEEEYRAMLPADRIYRPLRPNPVNLKKRLPIYLEYHTCFVDENGVMQYRDDIYEKEENILKMLKFEK